MGIAKFKDRQYLIKLERIRKGRDAEFQLGLGTQPAAAAAGEHWIIILNMERDSEQSDQDKWFSWAETEPCAPWQTTDWITSDIVRLGVMRSWRHKIRGMCRFVETLPHGNFVRDQNTGRTLLPQTQSNYNPQLQLTFDKPPAALKPFMLHKTDLHGINKRGNLLTRGVGWAAPSVPDSARPESWRDALSVQLPRRL